MQKLNLFLRVFLLGLAIFMSILVRAVFAVRPFVTDDARVVGEHQGQVETSVRYSKDTFSNLNLAAFDLQNGRR